MPMEIIFFLPQTELSILFSNNLSKIFCGRDDLISQKNLTHRKYTVFSVLTKNNLNEVEFEI